MAVDGAVAAALSGDQAAAARAAGRDRRDEHRGGKASDVGHVSVAG